MNITFEAKKILCDVRGAYELALARYGNVAVVDEFRNWFLQDAGNRCGVHDEWRYYRFGGMSRNLRSIPRIR